MKIKTLFIFFILSLILLNACNDYLDPSPRNKYSERLAWDNFDNAKLYLNSYYKNIREFSLLGGSTFGGINTDGLTDILKYGSNVPGQGNANQYAFQPSRITPDQNALGIWSSAYDKIRRINEFLEGLRSETDFNEEQILELESQARFVRGYIYYSLIMRHGSVILLDKTTSSSNNPRSPEEDCWDFVEADIDFAISHLPKEWSDGNWGRFTKGSAYALKSRVMLYAKRWDKAIKAAEEVIKMEDEGLYALADDYSDAFLSRKQGNKEAILEFYYTRPDLTHNWDLKYAPGGDKLGSGAQATPTQNFIEEYETKSGEEVDWSIYWDGSTQIPPYENLEPRFHASVLYNEATWKGRKIESFKEGVDGYMDYGTDTYPNGKTTTGYFLKKYLDESLNNMVEESRSDKTKIEIRYAEVLLNYAEACAMTEGREKDANNAIRKIRARVGLPYQNLSSDELIEKIRKERKIELAFEGHRYWDLRRWQLSHKVLNNFRTTAMKITQNGDNFYYQIVYESNQERKFLERLYYFPIPSAEIANNTAISQIEPW